MSRSEATKVVPVVEAATDRPASIPVKLVPTKPGGWDPFDAAQQRGVLVQQHGLHHLLRCLPYLGLYFCGSDGRLVGVEMVAAPT